MLILQDVKWIYNNFDECKPIVIVRAYAITIELP